MMLCWVAVATQAKMKINAAYHRASTGHIIWFLSATGQLNALAQRLARKALWKHR